MMKREKDPAAVSLGRRGGAAKTKTPKGFAAISAELRRKIATMGGKATLGIPKRKKQDEQGQ